VRQRSKLREQFRRGNAEPILIVSPQIWMRQQRALFFTKNDTETAIVCRRNRWTAFVRFLDDGRVCL
jgi:transposase